MRYGLVGRPRISGTSGSSTWGFAWPELAWTGLNWPDFEHLGASHRRASSFHSWMNSAPISSLRSNSLKIALTLFLHIIRSRKPPKIWWFKSNPYSIRRKGMLSQPVFKAFERVILWDQTFKICPNWLWWCRPRGPCAIYFTKQSFPDTKLVFAGLSTAQHRACSLVPQHVRDLF